MGNLIDPWAVPERGFEKFEGRNIIDLDTVDEQAADLRRFLMEQVPPRQHEHGSQTLADGSHLIRRSDDLWELLVPIAGPAGSYLQLFGTREEIESLRSQKLNQS